MTQTVLITLGRLPKGLDVARSFAAAGWRVVVADPFAWHLCRVSKAVARSYRVAAPLTDKDGFLRDLRQIIADEGVTLVIPVSEETIYVAELVGALEGVRVYASPPQTILPLHDKAQFIAAAHSFGLSAPETHPLDSREARALAARKTVVIKPVFSCSGRGVAVRRRASVEVWPTRAEPTIVQSFVAGSAQSSFSIVHDGRPLITIVYRGLVMSGTVAVCFERLENPAIEAWVETFAAQSGAQGFLAFDFIVDAAGVPWAIECNPRLTSGVHFITPETLAPALINPATAPPPERRPEARAQQFYPVLTEAQSPFFWRPAFKRNARYLFTTRDVSWSASDPWPFVLLPFLSYEIMGKALLQSMTFGEAATADLEWRPAS